jgi:hypothetical protein
MIQLGTRMSVLYLVLGSCSTRILTSNVQGKNSTFKHENVRSCSGA